ncbi:MAG: oxidoreductase [Chitinivibrionales bacterium]|nr:oxidoreductase [Chitinivibrionales bacterium]
MRNLTESTFVIRFERGDLAFCAGQYVNLAPVNDEAQRSYSLYSAEHDDFLEILVKEVDDGYISKRLKMHQPGDQLRVEGPFGFFTIDEKDYDKSFLFVASGTGLAPVHSFVASYPALDYIVLHGVRYAQEAYEKDDYDPDRHILCTSRDSSGRFVGRVTDCLAGRVVAPETHCYLCGNHQMIYDIYELLRAGDVHEENIHTEVYF